MASNIFFMPAERRILPARAVCRQEIGKSLLEIAVRRLEIGVYKLAIDDS